ncbi:MAG: hypothetical protein K5945_08455 [Bacteroidaceae bacterium]|nr:hypothetical protein [Bacteroidaceae bacterium]
MKYYNIPALTLCLSLLAATATAQNVTLHKQGGVGQVYEVEKVDSVVYFPIGDAEPFPASESENTTTLWDAIKAQPNLKKFAAILEAGIYYTSKGKPSSGLHLSQLLEGAVPLSVYAPADAAISDEKYAELLALAKTDGWRLQQEFAFNHISPQEGSDAGNGGLQMLNGKIVGINANSLTPVNQEVNNGLLYVLSSCFDYAPNLEEYLQAGAPDCTLARDYMTGLGATDAIYNIYNSLCVPTKEGRMEVLDSTFTRYNPMTKQYIVDDGRMQVKGFGANLADEKASYRMVTPTDAVWSDGLAKLAPLYKYSSRYENKVEGDKGYNTTVIDVPNPDSLSAVAVGANLLVPLLGRTVSGQETRLSNGIAYAASQWPVPRAEYKPDLEMEVVDGAYYYQSSDKYYTGTGVTMSFSYPGFTEGVTDKYGKVSNDNFYQMKPKGTTHPKGEIKLVGEGGAQVLSGKYDIYVVMVPYWYAWAGIPTGLKEATRVIPNDVTGGSDTITYYPYYEYNSEYEYINKAQADSTFLASALENVERLKDEHFVDSVAAKSKNKFKVQLRYNKGAAVDATSSAVQIDYDAQKVDTIKVIEDFEFPYSYKDLPVSYPTMIIQGNASSSDLRSRGYIRELCIDKVILRSKEDDSEIVVTP